MLAFSAIRTGAAVGLTTLLTGCITPNIAPILQDSAFEPITPVVPVTNNQITGSIFADSSAQYQFGYKRSYRVGDIITVVLTEATQAQRQSGVETKREGTNNPLKSLQGVINLTGNLGIRGIKSIPFDDLTVESKGNGTANQAASLNGAVAATVIQVLPNQSLLVKGQKRITLSEGSEVIQLLGIVAINDIQPDNTVLSSRLANAQIAYQGSGNLAAVSKVPWGTNAFLKVWPF